jgi:hypothetical protein
LAELAHWREAVRALADLDTVASPEAWGRLEGYMRMQLRARLAALVGSLEAEAAALTASVNSGVDTVTIRRNLLRLRYRYTQVETVLDFYGDAVNTRTNPALGRVLRGLDMIASDALDVVLRPLGIDAAPVLVYLDKGLGASILRAGVRLWDKANPSPAAAIKITRHNLGHPTALLHEVGHQASHQTGWNAELAATFDATLRGRSRELAELWSSWSSEVAADVFAFCLAGWAPVPALANVVDGTSRDVYRLIPGDPHPFPFVRVVFNAALCRSWFGQGPWDTTARAWLGRHEPSQHGDVGRLAALSIGALNELVDVCTRRSFDAFRGAPLSRFADPRRVSPDALAEFAQRAGAALDTSEYLARREPLRVFTYLATQAIADSSNTAVHRARLRDWLGRLDHSLAPAA